MCISNPNGKLWPFSFSPLFIHSFSLYFLYPSQLEPRIIWCRVSQTFCSLQNTLVQKNEHSPLFWPCILSISERLKTFQGLAEGTYVWKFTGPYHFVLMVMVIIEGVMIRFCPQLYHHRRRMQGLVSPLIFLSFVKAFVFFFFGEEKRKVWVNEREWSERMRRMSI